MKVFVLEAVRINDSIDMRSGTWRFPAKDYKVLQGELVEQVLAKTGINAGKTIYHVKKDDGKIYFYEEYFKTIEEAETRRKELLGIR